MTRLSQKLAELKDRFITAHGEEHRLVVALNRRLEQQDAHLADELVAVIEQHDARRAGLRELLQALSARVGVLPPPREVVEDTAAIDRAIDHADAEAMPRFLGSAPTLDTIATH